jgi:hypothetical protein
VQTVIGANMSYLAILGFVSAEPGFPVIHGAVHKEQAVIVFVTRKRCGVSATCSRRAFRGVCRQEG